MAEWLKVLDCKSSGIIPTFVQIELFPVVKFKSLLKYSLGANLLYIFKFIVLFKLMLVAASKLVGAGLATIGLTGAGVGIGTVFGCLVLATSRNPNKSNMLFRIAMLGFAFTEAIALFALMMALLILFAF